MKPEARERLFESARFWRALSTSAHKNPCRSEAREGYLHGLEADAYAAIATGTEIEEAIRKSDTKWREIAEPYEQDKFEMAAITIRQSAKAILDPNWAPPPPRKPARSRWSPEVLASRDERGFPFDPIAFEVAERRALAQAEAIERIFTAWCAFGDNDERASVRWITDLIPKTEDAAGRLAGTLPVDATGEPGIGWEWAYSEEDQKLHFKAWALRYPEDHPARPGTRGYFRAAAKASGVTLPAKRATLHLDYRREEEEYRRRVAEIDAIAAELESKEQAAKAAPAAPRQAQTVAPISRDRRGLNQGAIQ